MAPGFASGLALAMLAAMLLAPGVPALADEAPATGGEQAFAAAAMWGNAAAWGETAGSDAGRDDAGGEDAGRDNTAWELSAGPTLADLAEDDAPASQPPVVGLRLRAAPVGLAVEVAEGVHFGAAGDFDPRTDEAVALVALRLSL